MVLENKTELLIKINDFEGPLDLLLHLIKETKMDIQEVPMLLIVDQYLAYIHSMKTMQLDIAGDYLVMAATLLEIKSRLLLPRVDTVDIDDDYEDEEDLQDELIRQLIEYKQFKEIADVLKEKESERGQYFAKSPSNLEGLQETIPLKDGEITLDDVLAAFQKMFLKQAMKQPIQAKIEMNSISVEETMAQIVTRLRQSSTQGVSLEEFVDSKSSLIASFLALLELTKYKKIIFKQDTLLSTIYIFKGENIDEEMLDVMTSGV